MFRRVRVPVTPVRSEPVQLPLTITLVIPDDPCVERTDHIFNVPGAIAHLIGNVPWPKVQDAIKTQVWAPGWSDLRVEQFVGRRFAQSRRSVPKGAIQSVRTAELFPAESGPSSYAPAHHVLHVVASCEDGEDSESLPRWGRLPGANKPETLQFGDLRHALLRCNVRLLILQVADQSSERTLRFASRITGSGGPATLVVSGGSPAELDAYLLDVYANIIHNLPLSVAANPRSRGKLRAVLFLGQGGDGTLQFHRWLDELRDDLEYLKTADSELVKDVVGPELELLHKSQVADLTRAARKRVTAGADAPASLDVASLQDLAGKIAWARESTGILPLSELAMVAPSLRRAASAYRSLGGGTVAADIRSQSAAMLEAAPRVLNANFAEAGRKRPLDPRKALRRGQRYELLVDVGPVWDKIPTLVQGSRAFPDKALPFKPEGHVLRVVFFSSDFQADGKGPKSRRDPAGPPVAAAKLWLPPAGRSHPIVGNKVGPASGPVRLPMTLPKAGRRATVARGRLSVYYEGNLLQSALVTVNTGRASSRGFSTPNAITVDYVFSGTFANLGAFKTRELTKEGGSHHLGVNIAMNGDGAGGHRLMIADRDDLAFARPYDPAANKKLLDQARLKLREMFASRDPKSCAAQGTSEKWTSGLDKQNGKALAQFKCDLWNLAVLGSDLYVAAFDQVSSPTLASDLRRLYAAMRERTVIQIARTSPAQYVFPWALVYDIPVFDWNNPKKLKWCPSIAEQWGSDGRRASAPKESEKLCPYHDTPEHRQNMLCPYGFWGLKHIIEQPINVDAASAAVASGASLMPDVASKVKWFGAPTMAVGMTRDAALDSKKLATHLAAVQSGVIGTPPAGAQTWTEVQAMLANPDIVYFLCHGEFDAARDRPYLGIGPRDADPEHRVYPDQLFQWARTVDDFWKGRRPLVFINGCHTANLVPDEILNFVTTFANFGASAVIGTEISIRLPLATEVAENLFGRLLQKQTLGWAIRELRWELACKGNLLGLAYTPYGLSSLVYNREGIVLSKGSASPED